MPSPIAGGISVAYFDAALPREVHAAETAFIKGCQNFFSVVLRVTRTTTTVSFDDGGREACRFVR